MAATAMATGLKTDLGVGWAPSVGSSTSTSQKSLLEHASGLGKSTGIISSKFFNDATPAGFGSHMKDRNYYWEIARQMVNEGNLTVVMGAGHPYYDKDGEAADPAPAWTTNADADYTSRSAYKTAQFIGKKEFEALKKGVAPDADNDGKLDQNKTGWTFIEKRSDFQKLGRGKTPTRVFGLAQCGAKALQEKRSTSTLDKIAPPYKVPFSKNVARIEEMTAGALNVLDNNPKGFVAMFEVGGAVDDACHEGLSGRVFEEYDGFVASTNVVLNWIKKNGGWDQNLLIITSDHDCGYLNGPGSGKMPVKTLYGNPATWRPIINNGKGKMPTFDFYSSFEAKNWNMWWHTNSLVPLWANGAGSENFTTTPSRSTRFAVSTSTTPTSLR